MKEYEQGSAAKSETEKVEPDNRDEGGDVSH